MRTPSEDLIPLLDSTALRSIRRTDKTLYKALARVSGRVAAQVIGEAPEDLLLWVYLTGVAHGAECECRSRETTTKEPPASSTVSSPPRDEPDAPPDEGGPPATERR